MPKDLSSKHFSKEHTGLFVVKKYFYKNYYFIFLDGFDRLILKIKFKK
jgi:hypothetical protein